MTSSLATSLAVCLFFATAAPSTDGTVSFQTENCVKRIVKLGDRTKKVRGETYHLLAIQCHASALISTDTTAVYWLLNDKLLKAVSLVPEKNEIPKGTVPVDIRILWVPLPK